MKLTISFCLKNEFWKFRGQIFIKSTVLQRNTTVYIKVIFIEVSIKSTSVGCGQLNNNDNDNVKINENFQHITHMFSLKL